MNGEWVPVEGRVVRTIGWFKERYGEENALLMMLREQVAPERSEFAPTRTEAAVPRTPERHSTALAPPKQSSPLTKPVGCRDKDDACEDEDNEANHRQRRFFADVLSDYSRHGVPGNECDATSADAFFTSFPLPGTFRVVY